MNSRWAKMMNGGIPKVILSAQNFLGLIVLDMTCLCGCRHTGLFTYTSQPGNYINVYVPI